MVPSISVDREESKEVNEPGTSESERSFIDAIGGIFDIIIEE